MDAVCHNGSLLQLVTLYRSNHMATHAAAVFCDKRLRELKFSFLHAVFAEISCTKRNRICYSLCRVELAHLHEFHRVATTACNLASFSNPCFESCKMLSHFI